MCSIDGCNGKVVGFGYCERHYRRFKNHGDPLAGRVGKYPEGTKCSVNGCNDKIYGKGLCQKHYDKEKIKNPLVRERCKQANKRFLATEKGKELSRSLRSLRRAKNRGAVVESFKKKEIFERDNWKCGLCGKPVNKRLKHPDPGSASLDHIIPLSRGGSHTRDNVQLAHLRCNCSKNNKLPKEFEEYKQKGL